MRVSASVLFSVVSAAPPLVTTGLKPVRPARSRRHRQAHQVLHVIPLKRPGYFTGFFLKNNPALGVLFHQYKTIHSIL
jgi:hypothetical protein